MKEAKNPLVFGKLWSSDAITDEGFPGLREHFDDFICFYPDVDIDRTSKCVLGSGSTEGIAIFRMKRPLHTIQVKAHGFPSL